MDDLDRVIASPDLMPQGTEIQQLGHREYGLLAPGMTEPVRATTDPAYYEEHSESVELWSPGNPLFKPPEFLPPADQLPPSRTLRDIPGSGAIRMPQYSPFNKPITDLQPSDLAVLKSVSEGWYVDYKRDLIDAGGMAKALSAFANSYGGWLFFGIKERSKDDPVAGEFCGLSVRDVDVAQQRLRQSAAGHLNPTPYFRTKVLRGPCADIGLAEGATVVLVEIPQSTTAPHIHKDGRIYRRVADGSEPKPETDRFILDQLWRRAEPIREMTREWIERDPELSKAEDEMPFLRLLFCVDPWQQRDPRLNKTVAEIRDALNSKVSGLPLVGFDTVYSTEDGFVARHKYNNDPNNQLLTLADGMGHERRISCANSAIHS